MADPTNIGSYNGYPGSNHWETDSRPLSEATNVLRSFVLQNIVQDNQWELDRITKYYLYWKFYEGMHYKDFNDGLLSFNYIRAFIDKVIMYLLGDEGFNLNVESHYTTQVSKELEKNAEELLLFHWNKSGKKRIAYEALQMGGITGDVWMGVSWNEEEEFCQVEVYDSRQCFPQFKGGNFKEMEALLIRQPLDKKSGDYTLQVTKFTKKTVYTWKQKDAAIDENGVTKFEAKEYKNPYGFIPVVHIKNRPNSASYYGKSDANDILKINKVYNELNQQIKSIIDYHATPTTIITGASAKGLKRGLGTIWSGLPPEANVFNLGLDVDLSSTMAYAKDLKTSMHELSDVPENALGKIQAISNTSAAALQITYHPLIQQANLKAIMYGEGFSTLNSMMLKIIAIKDPDNERLQIIESEEPDYLRALCIRPIFAYGFPKDKMEELQRSQMELGMKVASRREVMQRMGKQNIPELLADIDKDMLEQAEMQLKVNKMAMEGGAGSEEEGGNYEEEDEYNEE